MALAFLELIGSITKMDTSHIWIDSWCVHCPSGTTQWMVGMTVMARGQVKDPTSTIPMVANSVAIISRPVPTEQQVASTAYNPSLSPAPAGDRAAYQSDESAQRMAVPDSADAQLPSGFSFGGASIPVPSPKKHEANTMSPAPTKNAGMFAFNPPVPAKKPETVAVKPQAGTLKNFEMAPPPVAMNAKDKEYQEQERRMRSFAELAATYPEPDLDIPF